MKNKESHDRGRIRESSGLQIDLSFLETSQSYKLHSYLSWRPRCDEESVG